MIQLGKKTLGALCLSLGIIGTAGAAQAYDKTLRGCVPEFVTDQGWQINHDPHGVAQSRYPFDLKIRNRGSLACNGRIRVSTITNSAVLQSPGGGRITYELHDERMGINVTPPERASANMVANLRLNPDQQIANVYSVEVSPDARLAAGEYVQNVTFEYFAPATQEVLASRTLQISYTVRASAQISLKGEYTRVGGLRTIDLGDLENRVYSPRTIVTVDATRSYQLTVTSENLGNLKHENANWSVPYRLSMGGISVDLSRRFQHNRISRDAVNDEYPLEFSVDGTENKRAGNYSDVLHFTVSSL